MTWIKFVTTWLTVSWNMYFHGTKLHVRDQKISWWLWENARTADDGEFGDTGDSSERRTSMMCCCVVVECSTADSAGRTNRQGFTAATASNTGRQSGVFFCVFTLSNGNSWHLFYTNSRHFSVQYELRDTKCAVITRTLQVQNGRQKQLSVSVLTAYFDCLHSM